MAQRVVFLDRDGTINIDHGFVHRIEDWHFMDGAPEAIKLLRDDSFAVVVVTNQSGIASGYYTEDDLAALHRHATSQLAEFGTCLDAIAYCPHGRDSDCGCRKPRIGMAKQIEAQLGTAIDYGQSWMIGDRISDIEFGFSLKVHTALLRSHYWTDDDLQTEPDVIADRFIDVAKLIVSQSVQQRG